LLKEPRTEEPRSKEKIQNNTKDQGSKKEYIKFKSQGPSDIQGAFEILSFVFFLCYLVFFCIPSLDLGILVLGSLYLVHY